MASSSVQKSKKARAYQAAIPAVAGVAFAIIALTNGPGMAYVIVAIVAGLCYALVHSLLKRRRY